MGLLRASFVPPRPFRELTRSPWLADVLTECAWAAAKTKGTSLSAFYRQIMRRQGKQKPSWP
jgi:hypothetical protein